jgi:pimeloyl-ACP methyl ester carboxylesterase
MRRLSLLSILLPMYMFATSIPDKALYLQGQSDKGIILAHGKGMNPDFKVVKPLRLALNKDIGFHTLSLQMPNQYEAYEEYEKEQPKVDAMIDKAIDFLHSKGVKTIYLMGHSLGAGMTSSYLVSHPNAPIAGYIAIGCRGNKSKLISCTDNMPKIKIKTLDIWGRGNSEDESYAVLRAPLVGEHYRQYGVEGADHVLDGSMEFVTEEIEGWLEQ